MMRRVRRSLCEYLSCPAKEELIIESLPENKAFQCADRNEIFKDGILSALLLRQPNFSIVKESFLHKKTGLRFRSQEKSGYCWLLAALNCVTAFVQKKYGADNIIFSKNYLIFCDKLEKANWFLENILSLLDADEDDRSLRFLLRRAMSDRGQWNMARNLIAKYGLLTGEIANDCIAPKNTGELNACLSMILRNNAARLRSLYAKDAPLQEIRNEKERMLDEMRDILLSCFGSIPQETAVPAQLLASAVCRTVSPTQFYLQCIQFPFEEYVSVYNDGKDNARLYCCDRVMLDGNVIGGIPNDFLHLTEDIFYSAVCKQVEEDGFCWCACDTGKFAFSREGVFDDTIFRFEKFDSLKDAPIPKTTINQYFLASMTHSVTLINRVATSDGYWWQALDSVPASETNGGFCYFSDGWFSRYVFQAVVAKKHLSLPPGKQKSCDVMPWDFFGMSEI